MKGATIPLDGETFQLPSAVRIPEITINLCA